MYRPATGKPPSAYKAAPRTFAPSAPQCPRCDKSVYAAEQVLGPGGREYHKHCLTCVSCKKTVQPGGFQEHEGDAYCKHCYGKLFGPKGLGYGGAMTGDYVDPLLSRSPYSSPGRSGTPNHRASGAFSESARVTGGGGESPTKDGSFRGSPASMPTLPGRSSIESPLSKYRTSRLQEIEDDRSNDSLGGMDLDNDEDGSTTSMRQQDALPDQRSRTHSINAAQQAEAPSFDDHTPSPAASPVKQQWAPPSASFRGSPLKHSMPSELPRPASPASSIGTSATESSGRGADLPGAKFNSNLGLLQSSGPALCRRCATPVYHAEQVVAGGHKWHKRCLRCAKCSKALDSHLMEKDNLPYCKRCYDDQWGLKSQGFVLRPGLH